MLWIDVLTKPKEVFAAEKANASVMGGVKKYALFGAIVGLLADVMVAFFGVTPADLFGIALPFSGVALFVIAPVISVLILVVSGLVINAVLFLSAKLLGGKGSFAQQYYLAALLFLPAAVVSAALNIVPLLGWVVGFFFGLYVLYLNVLAFREAHEFSTLRAVVALILPVGLIVVVGVAGVLAGLFAPAAGPAPVLGLLGGTGSVVSSVLSAELAEVYEAGFGFGDAKKVRFKAGETISRGALIEALPIAPEELEFVCAPASTVCSGGGLQVDAARITATKDVDAYVAACANSARDVNPKYCFGVSEDRADVLDAKAGAMDACLTSCGI